MTVTKLFSSKKAQVKLGFSTIGDIIIDGFGFSFGIESLGKASKEGFLVSVSGDAVDKGLLTLDKLELHILNGGTFKIRSYNFSKVSKKDGGYAYQVAFKGFGIAEKYSFKNSGLSSLMPDKKMSEMENEMMMDRIAKEIMFKFTGKYSSKTPSEALIAVIPYENVIGGIASRWVKVTSDRDHYKKLYGI